MDGPITQDSIVTVVTTNSWSIHGNVSLLGGSPFGQLFCHVPPDQRPHLSIIRGTRRRDGTTLMCMMSRTVIGRLRSFPGLDPLPRVSFLSHTHPPVSLLHRTSSISPLLSSSTETVVSPVCLKTSYRFRSSSPDVHTLSSFLPP